MLFEHNGACLVLCRGGFTAVSVFLNSAWRLGRVDAGVDPGGRGKELVGKGLDTVRARLVTGRARLVILCATLATVRFKKDIPQTKLLQKSQDFAKKLGGVNLTKKTLLRNL